MRTRILVFGLALGLLAVGAAAVAGWDPRDVEAARAYQKAERERAERYRAAVRRERRPAEPASTRSRPGPTETARAERAPEAPARRQPAPHAPGWIDRAVSAVTREVDVEAIGELIAEAEAWVEWWNEEAAPLLERHRDRGHFAPEGESYEALPFTTRILFGPHASPDGGH